MRAMSEPGRPRPNPEEVQIEPTLVHRKSVAQAKL